MEPNPNQPHRDTKESVSALAKVQRLIPFNDLSLIGKYAEKFGKDPDLEVFPIVSFATLMAFSTMWKEVDEYHERFNYIYSETKGK